MGQAATRILLGVLALATLPVVGWYSFSYHIAVGMAVTLVYGSAAVPYGTTSIVAGIAAGREDRQLAADEQRRLPAARTVERRKPSA